MNTEILIIILLLILIILSLILLFQMRDKRKGNVNIGPLDQSLLVSRQLERDDRDKFFKNIEKWKWERDRNE